MQLGAAVAATLPTFAAGQHFLTADPAPTSGIQWGCAALTWQGNDTQAIQEIGTLGFRGIQLRANIYPTYGPQPEVLRQLLRQANLQMPVFSSGNANIGLNSDEARAQLERHVNHARLVKAVGGQFLQLTNEARPKEGNPTAEDLKKYGTLLTEIGKRVADEGVTALYHNHMYQLGQTPKEVEQIFNACDTRYVKLLLDIAHYQQGGGDPVKAIRKYSSILKVLHLKDVRDTTDSSGNQSFQFVELGRGRVNLPAVFQALRKNKFKGWAIVELDGVPDPTRTPLEATTISRDYLRNRIKANL